MMRAREEVYHLECFSCASCGVLLTKGDHFGMRDGLVYCRPHYEILRHRDYCGPVELEPLAASPPASDLWTSAPTLKGRPRKRKLMSPEPASDIPVNMRIHQGTLGKFQYVIVPVKRRSLGLRTCHWLMFNRRSCNVALYKADVYPRII